MKLIAMLASCWLAAALATALGACWPASLPAPDPFCAAALLWAGRERGALGVCCGGLLGLASDLGGSAALGPGIAVLSLAAWLAARWLPPDRPGIAAAAAGGAALALRLVLAALALVQYRVLLPWPALAIEAMLSAVFTSALAWPAARLMARRRAIVPGW